MGPIHKPFGPLAPTDRAWLALVLVAASFYLFGLGSSYAPTNGDEMVYIHIARMTAESGHWLPLQSELRLGIAISRTTVGEARVDLRCGESESRIRQ